MDVKMPNKLEHVKKILPKLDEYNMSQKYERMYMAQCGGSIEPKVAPRLIERYEKAKSKYLQKRIMERLMEHIETFDGESFQFPPPSEMEKNVPQNCVGDKSHNREKIKQNSQKCVKKLQEMFSKYELVKERRKELQSVLQEIDSNTFANDVNAKDGSVVLESTDCCDEKFTEQEERLSRLVRMRMNLQLKLEALREEKKSVEEKNDLLMDRFNGIKEDLFEGSCKTGLESNDDLVEREKHNEKLKIKIQQLREKSSWYESVREAMEELGGVKIISVQQKFEKEGNDNDSVETEKTHLLVSFLLFDKYSLHVTLLADSSTKLNTYGKPETLVIKDAQIKSTNGDTNEEKRSDEKKKRYDDEDVDVNVEGAKDLSGNKIDSDDLTVSLPLPALDNLILISQTFDGAENIRFFLRETLARLYSTELRANELSTLRQYYVTKILKSGQKIVCSIDEGITVIIHFTEDCPTLFGSAYIEDIVGIGGWNDDELEQLKEKVNARASRGNFFHTKNLIEERSSVTEGPIMIVMNILVEEVKLLNAPGTPKLPLSKNL